LEYILICILVVVIIFILLHLRPLNPKEVLTLAEKRRKGLIRSYFSFAYYPVNVDVKFKKAMESAGRFYLITENVSTFPSVGAGLLKYKKHEWIILGFEKNKEVVLIWTNKGPNNTQVFQFLDLYSTIQTINEIGATSVLALHNHPNPNPSRYSIHYPSDNDMEYASWLAQVLNANGVNLIAFVCERGRPYEFFSAHADNFYPLHNLKMKVETQNGKRWLMNLKLHWERITT